MDHENVVEAVANWFKEDKNVVLVTKGYGKGFPNPDVMAQYKVGRTAVAECKPSDAGGREYVTGIGQCLAYLLYADFSYLALPDKELREYQKYFWVEEVGLLSVRNDLTVQVIRQAQASRVVTEKIEPRVRGYGYYRDLRPMEIYSILKAIHNERIGQKKIDVKKIENVMWKQVLKMREIRSQKQKNAWILNMKLLLRDLQLVNLDDYSLTEDGFRLLQLGDLPNKEPYLNELAKCFLVNANFLDILTVIQNLNDEYVGFSTVSEFKDHMVKKMIEEKLATERTNVMRDLQDIPRVLKDLELLSEWKKYGLAHRYNINWKKVLSTIGYR